MKNKKSKWTRKPNKKGWYWIRHKDAEQAYAVGEWGQYHLQMRVGFTLIPFENLWNCEFHPVTPPK